LISAAVEGQGGGAGDPPCKPCQNVTEGSLQGMYYHNKGVISEQCDCVYNGPAGQHFCLQPEGLYTTTTCTDGTVPNELRVSFGNINVTPNDRLEQSQMRTAPTVSWDAEAGALYTLILEDQDVNLPQGSFKYAHWMVSNIQGSNVSTGNINIPYVPSGPFEMKNNNTEVDMSTDYTHRYLFVVYKQPGRINADEAVPAGCSSVVLFDHNDLKAKYNLEGPVAENFYRCGFSLEYFTAFSCSFSKCIGFPFPVAIPGINDGAECTA